MSVSLSFPCGLNFRENRLQHCIRSDWTNSKVSRAAVEVAWRNPRRCTPQGDLSGALARCREWVPHPEIHRSAAHNFISVVAEALFHRGERAPAHPDDLLHPLVALVVREDRLGDC